jgi:hypothetical protein
MPAIEIVPRLQRRFHRARPNHACVQHPLAAEVLHIREASVDLVRDVESGNRLADDRVILRLLERCLGVHFELHVVAADQLRVADARAAGFRANDAVVNDQIITRNAEARRRLRDQRIAGGGRRLADLHAAVLYRQAGERDALIGGEQRVALDHVDPHERHRQFFRRDLRHRRPNAGPEIDLARIHGHATVSVDREKAVDLIERHCFRRHGADGARRHCTDRERHHEHAAGLEEIAPAETLRIHRRGVRHRSLPLRHRFGRALDRAQDPDVRAAAA